MAKSLHLHHARDHRPHKPLVIPWESAVLLGGIGFSILLFMSMLWVDQYLGDAETQNGVGVLSAVQPVTARNRDVALATSWTSRWKMTRQRPLFLVQTSTGRWVTDAAPPQPIGTHLMLLTTELGSQYLCPSDTGRGCVVVQP